MIVHCLHTYNNEISGGTSNRSFCRDPGVNGIFFLWKNGRRETPQQQLRACHYSPMTGESSLAARWLALNTAIERHHFASLYGMATGMLLAATGLLLVFRYSTRVRSKQAQFTIRASVAMQWISVTLFSGIFISNYLNLAASPDMKWGVFSQEQASALWLSLCEDRHKPSVSFHPLRSWGVTIAGAGESSTLTGMILHSSSRAAADRAIR